MLDKEDKEKSYTNIKEFLIDILGETWKKRLITAVFLVAMVFSAYKYLDSMYQPCLCIQMTGKECISCKIWHSIVSFFGGR